MADDAQNQYTRSNCNTESTNRPYEPYHKFLLLFAELSLYIVKFEILEEPNPNQE